MASRKIRDVVVKVGEYIDRNTGETRGRFENVGALMQSDEDNSFFIMLKRTFNPAGVPGQDARESILLSCYVPKEQRQQPDSGAQQHQQSPAAASGGGTARQSLANELNDDVPFFRQWD